MHEAERDAYLKAGRQTFYGHLRRFNPLGDLDGALEFVSGITGNNLPRGLDSGQLAYITATYHLPPALKFFYFGKNNYLRPSIRRIAEFALASRFTSDGSPQTLLLDTYGEISVDLDDASPALRFKQHPRQSFLADQILLASIASTNNGRLFYPHLDTDRRIVAATEFSVTEAQRYFIERKAREVFVQTRKLKQLYPVRTFRGATFNQNPDGELSYKIDAASGTYRSAVLFFPVGQSGETLNLAIAETGRTDEEAHYRSNIDIIAYIKKALERILPYSLQNRQIILNNALHEQNHLLRSHLPLTQQWEVRDMFDSNDKNLIEFAQSLWESHINIARDDLERNPGAEAIFIQYKGSGLRIAKRSVVSELLAFATAAPNTPDNLKSKLIGKNEEIAWKCIQALSDEQKQKLKDYKLIMDARSTEFREFFMAFEQALTILEPGYIPTYIQPQENLLIPGVGRNRFRHTSLTITNFLFLLMSLGLGSLGYFLTHDGIGLTFADGREINLKTYYSDKFKGPALRLELQISGPTDTGRPFANPDGPLYYPKIRLTYYMDIGSGVRFDAEIREDFMKLVP